MNLTPIALLAAVALVGCQAKTSPAASPAATAAPVKAPAVAVAAAAAPAPNGTRDWTDDELHEIGQVTAVEDGGYPRYIVTIVFHPGQPGFDLNANAEALGLGSGGLEALKGKTVTVYYTSEDEPDLRDIRLKGASVLGDDAPESVAGLSKISGRLSGAGDVSGGDLPDTITVTTAGGKLMSFEAFISTGMTKADGQEVTVFYDTRPMNRITYLKAN